VTASLGLDGADLVVGELAELPRPVLNYFAELATGDGPGCLTLSCSVSVSS
jgi:hypothetical protein